MSLCWYLSTIDEEVIDGLVGRRRFASTMEKIVIMRASILFLYGICDIFGIYRRI